MVKRILKWIALIAIAIYLVVCSVLYSAQEKMIFFPQKIDAKHSFNFNQAFEELTIESYDGTNLNGVLIKTDSAKGLIFYLHGNAGSILNCGHIANYYTGLNYDVFILDYRGFGKSEGEIGSQKQMYEDIQITYDSLKHRYREENIVVIGYSIGTGPASNLSSENSSQLLILQAPYYSLPDLMKQWNSLVPAFLLKYKFNNYDNIEKCTMPVMIFHGDEDGVIYYGSSLKLKEHIAAKDTVIILPGQTHVGITQNPIFKREIEKVLR